MITSLDSPRLAAMRVITVACQRAHSVGRGFFREKRQLSLQEHRFFERRFFFLLRQYVKLLNILTESVVLPSIFSIRSSLHFLHESPDKKDIFI